MKDESSCKKHVVLIGAAALAADNTPVAVDLRGFQACTIALSIGAGGITFTGTNKIEFVLTHSDDDSTYSNVTGDDLVGRPTVTSGIIKSLTAAHASAAVYRFGYIGNKRYIKLLADFSGTHGTGTPIAATAILEEGDMSPQAAQA